MTTRLYVGNLSSDTTEADIKTLFTQHGTVESVTFIRDFDSGQLRGFGFIDVATEHAAIMIAEINGREVDGRHLKVNEARPRGDGRGKPRFVR
jgi:RNA recognition motif-containing protein